MILDVAAGTGVVRVDPDGLARLREAHAAGAAEGPAASALAVQGVPEALDALSAPLVVAELVVAGPDLVTSSTAFLDRDVCALLLAVHDEVAQLLVTAPAAFPAAVARVVRLGPRHGRREPAPVEQEVLEDLAHADGLRRSSAYAVLGADWSWTLDVRWQAGERQLAAVDGSAGLALVEREGEGWALRPATATEVWRLLTRALPGDEELAG
ncbi:hypothetical protein EV189_2352 [Motilibacter rhizosphaerae]|uniref:ESAT-6 protein secretion system EspG family protein n=1 Tax=Motilibacter rhizosphaerae TaxID=598652 RepID=A0A4Q7NNV0_9ACTN|nr:hypothetical protein [Motilibacter rhizosphaerae]RZS86934.1 hypothetical protein EV189_2352 [Motilibacter rhizosphaerae]